MMTKIMNKKTELMGMSLNDKKYLHSKFMKMQLILLNMPVKLCILKGMNLSEKNDSMLILMIVKASG